MLAVFKASVAEGPAELVSPHRQADVRKNGIDLINSFLSANSGAVCVNFGDVGAMAYIPKHQSLLVPRAFVAMDDIFCLFEGTLDNIMALRQQYGLNKSANEVTIVIEAYRTLRDRGPYPADQVVRDLSGKFAFLLFDFKSQTLFTAADADGSVPFFWGTAADGCLVLSDEVRSVKDGCGKSFAPFPRGCFFSTSGGLQSFEHPRNKLMPLPHVDSEGHMCGANFKVDELSKKGSPIPRVGSEANWANTF
ncbi:hypothetical protein SUGI_1038810 [Cryptomeria japonica]|uniref:stem-specific protein TSJT1 n=1 Tax=Cryptomeria japonica TaxID=3369 RepID=UPI002414BB1A|nr:stem-specific protein TSJT1 [Cryptomeria japonica]GLJ49206.1 hypothetical protein SUGI_1038810 [Cryptomeria japonica]